MRGMHCALSSSYGGEFEVIALVMRLIRPSSVVHTLYLYLTHHAKRNIHAHSDHRW